MEGDIIVLAHFLLLPYITLDTLMHFEIFNIFFCLTQISLSRTRSSSIACVLYCNMNDTLLVTTISSILDKYIQSLK